MTEEIPSIGPVRGLEELGPATTARARSAGPAFANALKEAIGAVDGLQKQSEAAQASFARGEPVDLHEVLIKVEEAEVAFKAMMEVRNKLVEAYREIMRMGSGS
jgi:flagellar hook-basal body complex protein FliE